VDLDTVLASHIEATAQRMQAHPVVLAVQDTTRLNYDTHPATAGLGPVNAHADGAQGLKLHDTVAFTPEGVPLGVIDAECWAREADIYELFAQAQQTPGGPDLLIRANRSRARRVETEEALPRLWEYVLAQPPAGTLGLHIPGKGGRKARTAELVVRHSQVTLPPPRGKHGPGLRLWAVQALEPALPPETEAVEWLLLTTVAVADFAQACLA